MLDGRIPEKNKKNYHGMVLCLKFPHCLDFIRVYDKIFQKNIPSNRVPIAATDDEWINLDLFAHSRINYAHSFKVLVLLHHFESMWYEISTDSQMGNLSAIKNTKSSSISFESQGLTFKVNLENLVAFFEREST